MKRTTIFDWRTKLTQAREALSLPPAREWIDRPRRDDALLLSFALPLELCLPFNRVGRAGTAGASWALGKLKRDCYNLMFGQLIAQTGRLPGVPLSGRPRVLCCRFSSSPVDRESGWSKNPVDRLRVGPNGLGIIRDDSEAAIDLRVWWEPAKRGQGFCLVEVRA